MSGVNRDGPAGTRAALLGVKVQAPAPAAADEKRVAELEKRVAQLEAEQARGSS